jgi:hypothetical protein
MAIMYVVEFTGLAKGTNGEIVPVASCNGKETSQVITVTGATASSAFQPTTAYIRVICDFEAHLEFGETPVAAVATSAMQVQANAPEYFGVKHGQKISAIAAV